MRLKWTSNRQRINWHVWFRRLSFVTPLKRLVPPRVGVHDLNLLGPSDRFPHRSFEGFSPLYQRAQKGLRLLAEDVVTTGTTFACKEPLLSISFAQLALLGVWWYLSLDDGCRGDGSNDGCSHGGRALGHLDSRLSEGERQEAKEHCEGKRELHVVVCGCWFCRSGWVNCVLTTGSVAALFIHSLNSRRRRQPGESWTRACPNQASSLFWSNSRTPFFDSPSSLNAHHQR